MEAEVTEVIYNFKIMKHISVKLVDPPFSPWIECRTWGEGIYVILACDVCIAKGHYSVKGTGESV